MFPMQQLCVSSEQRDFDFHNFINLEEELEDDNINHIVIYFHQIDTKQIDSERWKKQIMDLSWQRLI